VPPGNNKDNDTWTPKRPQKVDIKLTPGKGIEDLNCSITDLIDQVVKSNKVPPLPLSNGSGHTLPDWLGTSA